MVPVQLCALVEIQFRGNSTFWFVGCEGETISRSKETFCPFPSIQYRLNKSGDHMFFFSKVDNINEPALVIPASLNLDDFKMQSSIPKRRKIRFTSIPFGFINRDDWLPNTNLSLLETEKNFREISYVKRIWDKDLTPLYDELKTTLHRNGNEGRTLEDADAIEEYTEETGNYIYYKYSYIVIHMCRLRQKVTFRN